MGLNNSKPVLARHLTELLASRPEKSRLDHSKVMGVADGTLGRIKYGTGNPTLESLDQIANYFRVRTWELIRNPEAGELTASQPVSAEALMIAADLADEALQGLWLPKPRYYELVALIHEGITRGLPYAQILEFARPAAQQYANRERTDEREPGLGAAGEVGHGRLKAAGNR